MWDHNGSAIIKSMAFKLFRHKSSGVIASYPEHYADHPVFGPDLEVYVPEDYEEDKVVVAGHELPVDQRGQVTATPLDELKHEELKQLAKEHELPVSGNRDDLIARIKSANTNEEI